MITINCCVCGKEYQIGSNELNRLWCSVGCQYGEDEEKQTCCFCDGIGECDFCTDGKDSGLI